MKGGIKMQKAISVILNEKLNEKVEKIIQYYEEKNGYKMTNADLVRYLITKEEKEIR